jgi:hypothetical protein
MLTRAILHDAYACAIVGGPDTVRRGLDDFIRRTGTDELMVTANIFDHAKRMRSFEIVAEVHGAMIKRDCRSGSRLCTRAALRGGLNADASRRLLSLRRD